MNEIHIKTLKHHLNHWKRLYEEHICEEQEGRETIEALQAAIKALQTKPCEDMGEVSDGYHTFNQLYYQRAVLFACIVNQNKEKAWKSFKHSDGKYCFDSNGEWFIVGVDTPQGSYTYHYAKEYWNMFECKELECGKEWDGHTEEDVTRLLSLPSIQTEPCEDCISFPNGTLKKRGEGYVVYNVEWLKKHWLTELKIMGIECKDAISRQVVLDEIIKVCFSRRRKWIEFRVNNGSNGERDYIINYIKQMPSVHPAFNCKSCVFRTGYGTGIDEGVLNALPKKMKEGE